MYISLFSCYKLPSNDDRIEDVELINEESHNFFSVKKIAERALAPQPEELCYIDYLEKAAESKSKIKELIPEERFIYLYAHICGSDPTEKPHLRNFTKSLIHSEMQYIENALTTEMKQLTDKKKIKSIISTVLTVKKNPLPTSTKEKIEILAELCIKEYFVSTIKEFLVIQLEYLLENKFDNPEMEADRKTLKLVYEYDYSVQYAFSRLPGKITYSSFEKELHKAEKIFQRYIKAHPKLYQNMD